jgi:hypothetical protein
MSGPELEFLAIVEGGIGPMVWDREITVWADNIGSALAKVESKLSYKDSVVVYIEQEGKRVTNTALQQANEIANNTISLMARHANEAKKQVAALTAQLPGGMKNCKILFSECPVGHGYLRGENWIEKECPWCKIAALTDRIKELEEEIERNKTHTG